MKEVRCLCGSPIDLDATYHKRCSRLTEAIADHQIRKALQLIRIGANINFRDYKDRTPLMCAAEKGDVEFCEFLIDHGANLEAADCDGETAYLHAAKVSKNAKVLELLEEAGCNIYVRTTDYNDSALFLAAEYNDSLEVVKHLLYHDQHADDNDDIARYTPLMAAIFFNKNLEIIKTLLKRVREHDIPASNGWTTLTCTARNDYDDPIVFKTVYSYLKEEYPQKIKNWLFKKDEEGKTMLEIAQENSNKRILKEIEGAMKEYAE